MNILLVTQYFWPESFRINDLVVDLVSRGHQVTVLTGKPNYPSGKIANGYKWWNIQKNKWNGCDVIRLPLIPRGNSSGKMLAINYLSFVVSSCTYMLFHNKDYDVSLTFGLSPITQAFPALLYKKKKRIKSYIWMQDLWPESVTAAGKMNNKHIMSLLSKTVRFIYNNVDGIMIQSKDFVKSINKIGDYNSKMYYIPNWAEDIFLDKTNLNPNKYRDLMPDGFKIMFAGNIGEAQDFDSIMKAVLLTKNHPSIKWVILGDGRKRVEIEEMARKQNLNNITFLGRYPLEEMPNFFIHADATLVSLKADDIFSMTIPSKMQSYMAFGKPIVTMLDGIGNHIVNEAGCGYTADACDYNTLAGNVIKISKLSYNDLKELGQKSQKYYLKYFSKDKIIDDLLKVLN